jgi:hypothetical protein
MGEMTNAYKILVGITEGKRPFERQTHKWNGNITMDLIEIGCEDVDLIQLAQNTAQWHNLANSVMNLLVH